MLSSFIPNSAPYITQGDIEAVLGCLRDGRIASNPENLRGAEEALMQLVDGQKVFLTTSCTAAIDLALSCLLLRSKDEVLLPSFTFVSVPNAVLRNGGKPVFVDIEEETLNIDLQDFEAKLTSQTRGVIPVHYAGISCDMDRLLEIARPQDLFVIEDAAHAIGARYRGKPLGTLGDFGCFSFHDTKNVVCGEGGALVVNDDKWMKQLECHYEKGANRSAFLRGEIDKYTWVSEGGSFTLSAILAALLESQLRRCEEMNMARSKRIDRYQEGLRSLSEEGLIRLPSIPSYAHSSHHIAYFLVRDPSLRDPLLQFLKDRSVGALFHYIPLHLSPYARERLGTRPGELPVTERIAESIVRLPLYPHLLLEDCDYIARQVHSFFHGPLKLGAKRRVPAQKDSILQKMQGETFDLTLVIPCFNEAPHLHASVAEIIGVLDRTNLKYELLLIDDGSSDGTQERLNELRSRYPHHPLRMEFHAKNQGRGATVTEGIRIARGRFVGFIDCDLEVHPRYIPAALVPLERGTADVVVADRSYKFHIFALKRCLISVGYRWLVRTLLKTPKFDTEAGFKFFLRERILPLLDNIQSPHWFWDTEITIHSHDRGLRICNMPVLFDRRQGKISTVRAFRDSWRSLIALLRFRKIRLLMASAGRRTMLQGHALPSGTVPQSDRGTSEERIRVGAAMTGHGRVATIQRRK